MDIKNIYSPLNPAALFMIQRRQREFREIFAEFFPDGVENVRLLEVGSGNGQWFAEFAGFGFRFANFAGIDISAERVGIAKERIPGADIRKGDAASLPWSDESFDVVFQSTLFTSVQREEKKKKIAEEMKRVCAKNGIILWYDFVFDNPANKNVKGVGKREIRELFAPWNCEFRKTTLAPPLARIIVPLCWSLAEDLETFFPFLRTHIVAVIKQVP
jgi:ubiquinone/menaquinone biosynthesis C-methylase UbiE